MHFGPYRSFPDTCAWSWTETEPVGFTRTYFGTSVYDGSLPYTDMRVTPSWGGSMFEALMPALFLPEERWGPGSWGANHPLVATRRSTTAWSRPATATGWIGGVVENQRGRGNKSVEVGLVERYRRPYCPTAASACGSA